MPGRLDACAAPARTVVLFLVLISGACVSAAAQQQRVVERRFHGVPADRLAAYSGSFFTCADGSRTLPLSAVNDDYCHCADGSDESGTAACSPVGHFWCANRGFLPLMLPSSRVRDGVCDCCDGSDEAQLVPIGDGDLVLQTPCQDSCAQHAAVYRAELEERESIKSKGLQERDVLIRLGVADAEELKQRKHRLDQDLVQKENDLELVERDLRVLEETHAQVVEEEAPPKEPQDEAATPGHDSDTARVSAVSAASAEQSEAVHQKEGASFSELLHWLETQARGSLSRLKERIVRQWRTFRNERQQGMLLSGADACRSSVERFLLRFCRVGRNCFG